MSDIGSAAPAPAFGRRRIPQVDRSSGRAPRDPGRFRRGYPRTDYQRITGRWSRVGAPCAPSSVWGEICRAPRLLWRSAARELRAIGEVIGASGLHQTSPRDHFDQPDFTNAVIELETDLEPTDLLFALKRLEMALGRDPQGMRFGPRLIDLDILVVDGRCVDDNELDLVIPHPRLAERRFALEPLAELGPGLRPWRRLRRRAGGRDGGRPAAGGGRAGGHAVRRTGVGGLSGGRHGRGEGNRPGAVTCATCRRRRTVWPLSGLHGAPRQHFGARVC